MSISAPWTLNTTVNPNNLFSMAKIKHASQKSMAILAQNPPEVHKSSSFWWWKSPITAGNDWSQRSFRKILWWLYVYILYVAGLLDEWKFEKWSGEEVLIELGFTAVFRLGPWCQNGHYLGWQALIKAEEIKVDSKRPALTRGGSQICAEIIVYCCRSEAHTRECTHARTHTINSTIWLQCDIIFEIKRL